MALPIKGGKITTAFGVKGAMWSSGHHEGVDFAVPAGTPVLAAADGTVSGVGTWGSAFGAHSVIINHGRHTECIYAHLMSTTVKAGDHVKKGQQIGLSGGRPGHPEDGNVSGPHLHFELQAGPGWVKGGGLDPAAILAV
jgi:murein DD-endopeptidase MepM/ murein hydrolase activator NlpD